MVTTGHQLRKTIAVRNDELSKFDTDIVAVVGEKTTAERTVRRL
jgi:hypothetical protein